VYCSIV